MLAKNVPDRLSVSAPPFTGVYQKRSGSRRDHTLFCWFNIEDNDDENDVFPHVSIHVDGNNELDELHVTFSVLTDDGKRRFANYYSVTGTRVKFGKESHELSFRAKDALVKGGQDRNFDVYQRDCDSFAAAFVDKAARTAGLPAPLVIDKGGATSPYQDVLGAPARRPF